MKSSILFFSNKYIFFCVICASIKSPQWSKSMNIHKLTSHGDGLNVEVMFRGAPCALLWCSQWPVSTHFHSLAWKLCEIKYKTCTCLELWIALWFSSLWRLDISIAKVEPKLGWVWEPFWEFHIPIVAKIIATKKKKIKRKIGNDLDHLHIYNMKIVPIEYDLHENFQIYRLKVISVAHEIKFNWLSL